jgi:hypothetical protein
MTVTNKMELTFGLKETQAEIPLDHEWRAVLVLRSASVQSAGS